MAEDYPEPSRVGHPFLTGCLVFVALFFMVGAVGVGVAIYEYHDMFSPVGPDKPDNHHHFRSAEIEKSMDEEMENYADVYREQAKRVLNGEDRRDQKDEWMREHLLSAHAKAFEPEQRELAEAKRSHDKRALAKAYNELANKMSRHHSRSDSDE